MINRGIQILGPTPGSLRAADGRTRGWSRVDIERPDLAQRYPFIIQHDSAGEERRFRLAGGRLHQSIHWVPRRSAAQLLQLQTLPRLHSVTSTSMDYNPRIHSQGKQMDGMQCL